MPIRWRLAGGSAVLTFVILAGFAAILDVLTTREVRGQFNDEMSSAVSQLAGHITVDVNHLTAEITCEHGRLSDYASAQRAQIRIFDAGTGGVICSQAESVRGKTVPATQPYFRLTPRRISEQFGYRVENVRVHWRPEGDGFLLYARPLSDLNHTLSRVRVFLILGVLGGTILALLAGLATAQRAMRPVAELSDAAREIELTRDPSRRLPHPEADDEVAELARTLEGMLGALDAARNDTEAMLARQREFVADASHELRTPLTSVLANLELLAEELDGDQADTAQAALRSTRRMRRLVGDLLLLARADSKRAQPQRPTDLASVLTEAAAELGPVAEDHDLAIDAEPALVSGTRDDLHRLALNLIENAVRHTPAGTHVRASTETSNGVATLIVEDDGPGIPSELRDRLFERFVRGGRDGGRGSGLGLAIVRAVAELHGGSVTLEPPSNGSRSGTRFVIRIPALGETSRQTPRTPPQTSTTTGSTIGRRRSRS